MDISESTASWRYGLLGPPLDITYRPSNFLYKSLFLGVLKRLRSSLCESGLVAFYRLYIRPILEYTDIVWSGLSKCQANRLERFQR